MYRRKGGVYTGERKGGGVFDNAIILAGGAGNRLWPASTNARPKYLLNIKGPRSLLQETLLRADAVVRSTIVVVTHHTHVDEVIEQIDGCLEGSKRVVVLVEPHARNTAPAVALAVSYLRAYGEEGGTICMPADHLIHPVSLFAEDVTRALEIVRQDRLTLFGIKPQAADTGYGYIEAGEEVGGGYRVVRFHEKPDREAAERYLRSNRFFWNSGIYLFNNVFLWRELTTHAPSIVDSLAATDGLFAFEQHKHITVQKMNDALRSAYDRLPAISIDYAVAERSRRVCVVPAHFQWNDVGSWDEISRLIDQSLIDNPRNGLVLSHDSVNNTVISEIPVALSGVNDIMVIVENGVVMICKKGTSQNVKQLAMRYAAHKRAKDEAGATV